MYACHGHNDQLATARSTARAHWIESGQDAPHPIAAAHRDFVLPKPALGSLPMPDAYLGARVMQPLTGNGPAVRLPLPCSALCQRSVMLWPGAGVMLRLPLSLRSDADASDVVRERVLSMLCYSSVYIYSLCVLSFVMYYLAYVSIHCV